MPVDLDQIEEELLKRAEEYEGYENLSDQLCAEAQCKGCTTDQAQEIADKVIARMGKLKTGKLNNQFGKPWDTGKIAARINELRW